MSIEHIFEQADAVVVNRNESIIKRIIEKFNWSVDVEEKDHLVDQASAEHERQQTTGIPDEEEQIITLFERRKRSR